MERNNILGSALLLLALCLTDSSAEVEPTFAAPLYNVTVAAGREARLACVVENLQNYKVAWIHQGWRGRAVLTVAMQVITKNPRVSVSREQRDSWTLTIANVTTTDRGAYMCQVNTDPPKKILSYVKVVVPPYIVHTPEDVTTKEGDNVTFTCGAAGDPPPDIVWRRENGKNFTVNYTIVREIEGGRLTLPFVTQHSRGAFLCMASNGIPPAVSARVQLFVKFAPTVLGKENMHLVEVGGDLVLRCPYTAYPRPTVQWMRADGTPAEGTVENTFELFGSGESVLRQSIKDHSQLGNYRCVVSNSLGTGSRIFSVVEIPASPLPLAQNTRQETSANASRHPGDRSPDSSATPHSPFGTEQPPFFPFLSSPPHTTTDRAVESVGPENPFVHFAPFATPPLEALSTGSTPPSAQTPFHYSSKVSRTNDKTQDDASLHRFVQEDEEAEHETFFLISDTAPGCCGGSTTTSSASSSPTFFSSSSSSPSSLLLLLLPSVVAALTVASSSVVGRVLATRREHEVLADITF